MLALVAATVVVVLLQRLVPDIHYHAKKSQNASKQLSTSNRAVLTSVAQKAYSCGATSTSLQMGLDSLAKFSEFLVVLRKQPVLNSTVSAIMSRPLVPEMRDIDLRQVISDPAAMFIMGHKHDFSDKTIVRARHASPWRSGASI